ncbi:MAG: hypothetical protein MAG715_00173 [Methanonatronarchaeales archaeon]|nr:hypothetical protein [Methanonatronarchaeales archaeon]
MAYRVLCDENVDPQVTRYLEKEGNVGVHVRDELGTGTTDAEIARYAAENNYVLPTNDSDFLDEEEYGNLKVLYFPDNRTLAYDLASLVAKNSLTLPLPGPPAPETFPDPEEAGLSRSPTKPAHPGTAPPLINGKP